jgi:hypothetical protein
MSSWLPPTVPYSTGMLTDPTGRFVGGPNWNHLIDLIMGEHGTEKIQDYAIANLQYIRDATLIEQGTDNFKVRNRDGEQLYSGSNAKTALQELLDNTGHVYIGKGTYDFENLSAPQTPLVVGSNTFIDCHPQALIQLINPDGDSGSALLRNNTFVDPGNSFIIISGGTWDGQTGLVNTDTDFKPTTANIHLENVEHVWLDGVTSKNAASECIKVTAGQTAWITGCHAIHSRQFAGDPLPIGKGGIHVTGGQLETIVSGNQAYDCGGEGFGAYGDSRRTIITDNITKYLTHGKGQILLEGNSANGTEVKQVIIAHNHILAKYSGMNIKSVQNALIHDNTIEVVPGGPKGEGIEIVGVCRGLNVHNNTILSAEEHGITCETQLSDSQIHHNNIFNVGGLASDTYSGIWFNISENYDTVSVENNLIKDTRASGSRRMKYGISYKLNGDSMINHWCLNNQIYNQLNAATIFFDWSVNGNFSGDTFFHNNTGFNPGAKLASPFNTTDNELGIGRKSTLQATYSANPVASTEYTIVMSPIFFRVPTTGTGQSLTIKDGPGGNTLISGLTAAVTGMMLNRGWTVNFGPITTNPTVVIVPS